MQRATFVCAKPALVARHPVASRPVVCSAHKNNIPMVECRAMTDEAIDSKVTQLKEDLFKLRIKAATRQPFKVVDLIDKRKDIARLLTAKREKSLALNMSKRDVRLAEKKVQVADGMAV